MRQPTPTPRPSAPSQPAPARWRDALSREEIASLVRVSTWRSLWSLAVNWGLILGAMAAVHAYPHPLLVIAALFVIGARQLGLAIFMHDASHHALLPNKRANDWVGNWLAAYPVWADMDRYRPYHLQHHNHNWTAKDPDLHLAEPFPITRASLARKVWRDLSGRTGVKFLGFALRQDLGADGNLLQRLCRGLLRRSFRGMLITNAALLGVASLIGHPGLYLLWVGAYLTTYTLVTRIRSIAEHSMPIDRGEPLRNTRTTLASWWERLLIAPNRVNYHLEHHLLMTVPHYNLPRMHALLRARGALEGALVAHGYLSVLRAAASATEA